MGDLNMKPRGFQQDEDLMIKNGRDKAGGCREWLGR